MIDSLSIVLNRAEQNLNDLAEQVGRPAVPHMPQTTNQAVVVVLEDFLRVIKLMREDLDGIA